MEALWCGKKSGKIISIQVRLLTRNCGLNRSKQDNGCFLDSDTRGVSLTLRAKIFVLTVIFPVCSSFLLSLVLEKYDIAGWGT